MNTPRNRLDETTLCQLLINIEAVDNAYTSPDMPLSSFQTIERAIQRMIQIRREYLAATNSAQPSPSPVANAEPVGAAPTAPDAGKDAA